MYFLKGVFPKGILGLPLEGKVLGHHPLIEDLNLAYWQNRGLAFRTINLYQHVVPPR